MPYLTELHCHTGEVSQCASIKNDELIDVYVGAGYTSLTITNHLSRFTFGEKNRDKYKGSDNWEEKIEFFLGGVTHAAEAAKGRLNILWGVELRSNTDNNDYLIHHVTKEFLLSHPTLLDEKVRIVAEWVRETGGLFCQAHPFRDNMKVKNHLLFDATEVYNGSNNHDSHNDLALVWAKRFDLTMLSGSDYHRLGPPPTGGILTDEPIRTNDELYDVLVHRRFTPLHPGEMPVYYDAKIDEDIKK